MQNYQNPISVLDDALSATWLTTLEFLPKVIFALVLFGLGWVCGVVAGRAAKHIIGLLRIDKALHSAGMDIVSEKAGFHVTVAGFIGSFVKWFIILVFTVASTDILGLKQVTELIAEVLTYIPNVLVAVIILVVAALLGDFVARLVSHSVQATGLHQARFVGAVSKWSIVIFGIILALAQLQIATSMLEVLFAGVVFAAALAFGLAFGLGGRDAAARFLEKISQNETK